MTLTTELRKAFESQRDAMVLADIAVLDELLADEFTLTHMTGYVQQKREWLADIANGEMRYHRMDDVGMTVESDTGRSVLIARTLTEATIWGNHGTWRLQLRLDYERRDGTWMALRSVASTW